MSEKPILSLVSSGIPEPYGKYIMLRNQSVSEHLGQIMGVPFLATIIGDVYSKGGIYCVPSKPLSKEKALAIGIKDKDDLFGAILEHPSHGDKIVLHSRCSNGLAPEGFSDKFSIKVRDSVLPGYSVFDAEAAGEAYARLTGSGYQVLAKDPRQSDADGQTRVSSIQEAIHLIADNLSAGLVLEAYLEDSKTISVGEVHIAGQTYSYVGHQTSVFHDGRNKYGGTSIVMQRGELEDLKIVDKALETAVSQAISVKGAFGLLGTIISRLNLDVVQGYSGGVFLSGVTDQSLRLGGASPAEVLGVEYLCNHSEVKTVCADVELHYANSHDGVGGGGFDDREVFLRDPNLSITAKVTEAEMSKL